MTEVEPASGRRVRVPGVFDLGLIALAIIYVVYVGTSGVGSHYYASADRVTDDGRVWLLATSALEVVKTLDTVQWVMLAGAVGLAIYRLGPRIWWAVALTGHIGSAIISYGIIELAILLDSGSADRTAAQADFGVSIVLAASLGAVMASAIDASRQEGAMSRGDRVALCIGLLGLLGMIAFSFGWYDVQHLIGYGIGFFLARTLAKNPFWVGLHGHWNQ
ncbi:MAG: hypothetical protein ACSLFI_12065 [Solirubrobacterales bacterium]